MSRSYPDLRNSERLPPRDYATASFSRPRRPPPASHQPPHGRPAQPTRTARPGPPLSSSTSRRRSDAARRVGQNVLQHAGTRFVEQQERRRTSQSHEHHESGGSAVGHAVTSVLLEQLLQEVWEYLVRHNFFRGPRNGKSPTSDQGKETHKDTQADTQPSQASQMSQASQASATEQRRRHRRQRRSEAMVASLDRLSSELENTYDAAIRILRHPEGETHVDDTLRTSVDDLRRAITRCMARVESVRRYHHRSRRTSRRRGSGSSVRLSRSATETSGRAGDSNARP